MMRYTRESRYLGNHPQNEFPLVETGDNFGLCDRPRTADASSGMTWSGLALLRKDRKGCIVLKVKPGPNLTTRVRSNGRSTGQDFRAYEPLLQSGL